MEYITAKKKNQIVMALRQIKDGVVIIYGPSGSLKTSVVLDVLNELNLVPEYIEDITKYKGRLLGSNHVGMTDIDCWDYVMKNKASLSKVKNLIVETRCLPSLHHIFKNATTINFGKASNSVVKKIYERSVCNESQGFTSMLRSKFDKENIANKSQEDTGGGFFKHLSTPCISNKDILSADKSKLSQTDLENIDGNLHRLFFAKMTAHNSTYSIYTYLGKLFYGKGIVPVNESKGKLYRYIYYNAINFVAMEDLYEFYDTLSMTESNDSMYSVLEMSIHKCQKRNPGFFSFKSFIFEDRHICNDIFREYKG